MVFVNYGHSSVAGRVDCITTLVSVAVFGPITNVALPLTENQISHLFTKGFFYLVLNSTTHIGYFYCRQ